MTAFHRLWRNARKRFRRDENGATALEFAMLSPAFILIMTMAVYVGYYFYCTAGLAYAVQAAARQVFIGNAQNAGVTSSQAFVDAYICPALPPMMNCQNVIVIAKVIRPHANMGNAGAWDTLIDYPNGLASFPMDNALTPFCIGVGSELVGMIAYYAMPFPGASTSYRNSPALFINSNAAFLNEPFRTTYSGC